MSERVSEIIIDKNAKQITFTNNGIVFSQFGVSKEILDLVENQTKEIERLNNIIDEFDKYCNEEIDELDMYDDNGDWLGIDWE